MDSCYRTPSAGWCTIPAKAWYCAVCAQGPGAATRRINGKHSHLPMKPTAAEKLEAEKTRQRNSSYCSYCCILKV